MEMIFTLGKALGRQARKVMRLMQLGDVTATYADVSQLHQLTGYRPKVMLAEGLQRFADWIVVITTLCDRSRSEPEWQPD